jgi:hypothetical protein
MAEGNSGGEELVIKPLPIEGAELPKVENPAVEVAVGVSPAVAATSPEPTVTPATEPAAAAPETPAEANPLDATPTPETSSDEPALIQNILDTESGEAPESLLGAAPELDESLLEEIEAEKSVLLVILKIVFWLLVVASGLAYLFFSFHLDGKYMAISSVTGQASLAESTNATNAEIINLYTSSNVNRYLTLKGYFDQFSFDGDSFIKNFEISVSQTASKSERSNAGDKLEEIKENLALSFDSITELLKRSNYAPLIGETYDTTEEILAVEKIFVLEAKTTLSEKAGELAASQDPDARRAYKNYLQAGNLVGNRKLKGLVMTTDFASLTSEETYNLIKDINKLIVNDLSTIASIKDARIKWSDIIDEIELRTIAVDKDFKGDFYEELGGVRYRSYEFDAKNQNITIVGETKRYDTKNFTMIANLIDELNNSDLFANGEMRSLNKSGSLSDGFVATLKLTLDLEDPTEETNQE